MSPLLTIIIPFFNEEGWIGKTVASLAAQRDQRFQLLLVDNGSTDGGVIEARIAGASLGGRFRITSCATPGKTHAMQHGVAMVETPYVSICDADTIYPEHYAERVITLFEAAPNAAAVMAIDLYCAPDSPAAQKRSAFVLRKSRRFAAKCHAGGYAQSFRTEALRAAGGFDTAIWPYVLEDHEIMHRVHRHGPSIYHADHYCFPSERRTSRDSVSWNRLERLMYRYMPNAGMDWFLYSFLAARFTKRKTMATALREKQWQTPQFETAEAA
jgi:glycosyltransferase involved in cell wall biosynthesis